MAASGLSPEPSQEVFSWLKSMPLAPEYRPTLAEFQDPIAYIHKIEKEASQYGICKIVPPVAPALKKTAISNLNRSLLARNAAAAGGDSKPAPTFTTRQQQIGFCPRKQRPVQKAVWQSGEVYTFQEFEAKAKSFEKSYLKKYSRKGSFSPLEIETLYWKATLDKPLTVEYANDMPGSAFVLVKGRSSKEVGEGVTVGETAWNMRGVSRAKGSLLRFMKEEIPGVTSPMVYIAMLFSWFAWHVEDHDLHSLNYLHMGAGKTWYGVPRDAAVAFEEVVRVHGYGGEINPLVTFSILGEKTTVVSPEVFISAGIPCCRLVQNAGEFVVTFPRAYHSGFSHGEVHLISIPFSFGLMFISYVLSLLLGFNCGEAANIATPEWLQFAKEAAIRRASINYPPMVSHFQLLYDLANELCSSSCGAPASIIKPRSSRLKDKKKSEVESLVKEQFVGNVIQHNNLLHILGEGSAIVLLPEGSTDTSVCSDLRVDPQSSIDPKTSPLFHYKEGLRPAKGLFSDDDIPDAKNDFKLEKGFHLLRGNFASPYERNKNFSLNKSDYMCNLPFLTKPSSKTENGIEGGALSDQRLFSCVTCGIVCFACAAVIQPKDPAAIYLMSADCSFFNDWTVGSGVTRDDPTVAHYDAVPPELNSSSRWTEEETSYHKSNSHQFPMANQNNELASDTKKKDTSALVLLASTYGNSSDSEEDHVEDVALLEDEMNLRNFSAEVNHSDSMNHDHSLPRLESTDRNAAYCDPKPTSGGGDIKWRSPQDFTVEFEAVNHASIKSTTLEDNLTVTSPNFRSGSSTIALGTKKLRLNKSMESSAVSTDEDSSRLHIFCLEHAVEVEQQLRPMGGVHVFLLCHPEYPKVESEAKLAAEELGIVHAWNDLSFRDASKEDEEKIRLALDSEEAIPGNRDWAVKLGINLFYSANLSRTILYSKQMAYNFVIYNAFGRTSPASSPTAMTAHGRKSGKQKKVVAGKWCGRVWMSTQVHSFLSEGYSDLQEQEKSSYDWPLQDEIGKKQECAKMAEEAKMSRKSSRKRKMRTEVGSTKKVKAKKNEDAVSDHSLENIHNNQLPRYMRGKKPKLDENEDAASYDSLDDDLRIESRRFSKRNGLKYSQREIDSGDMVDSSAKQQKRNIRGQRVKSIEKEDEISDDSPGYTSCEESGRIPVSWNAKSIERQHSPLDEEEQNSPRGKLIKNVAGDEDDSTTLVPENAIKQYRRRSTMTRAKSVGNEFKMSDDILEGRSYKQLKRIPRNQHRKCTERDDAFSDDSLEGNSLDDHRAVIRKTSKFTDAVHSASDDSLGHNSPVRRRMSHGSKEAEYDESEEDAVSYDLPDENYNYSEHLSEVSARSKKGSYVEREDVSYDSCDADVPQHSRKIPRKKRNSFYDREDAISYDSENNNTPKQQLRTPRDGLKKTQTRQKARREISQQPSLSDEVAQWSCPRKKQGAVEKRNSRLEKSIGDSDSCAEDDEMTGGPSTRLRKRVSKPLKKTDTKPKMKKPANQKLKNSSPVKAPVAKSKGKVRAEEGAFQCDMEGCSMSFTSKQELSLHKRNICPVKGCGKKFFSHKYLVQHRRVHVDDRPLKCPWKGCKMTFKWAWARTEHIRVHTGARPYVCGEPGCGQTFRFVSDFSRHKRKTGHSGKKAKA